MQKAVIPGSTASQRRASRRASGGIEARLIALVTAAACVLLLFMVGYAGLEMNRSALDMEARLIGKEIDRLVAKTLDEQKSVTLWDEAVRRAEAHDQEWLDDEIGDYLSRTYGHDRVFVLNGADRLIYAYPGTALKDDETRHILAAAAPLIAEVRGRGRRSFISRDRAFQIAQRSRSQTADGRALRAAANLLAVDGQPVIVSVMAILPTTDKALLGVRPPLEISVLKVDPRRLAALGANVDVKDVHLNRPAGHNVRNGITPFSADDGTPLGWLSWQPVSPARTLLTIMLPLLAFASAWAIFACLALLQRLMASAQRLRESETAALALANSDPVSGLPNRRAFTLILEERLNAWRMAQDARPMLACLDLDRFKTVNDTLGHDAGDRLVVAVSDRLKERLDPDCALVRLGGDEFAVIGPCRDDDAPQRLAHHIADLFAEPFDIIGHHVGISTSIGIAVASQADDTPVMMARYADIALYEAKIHRGSAQIFRREMSHAVERRHQLETELDEAIRTGKGLRLVYQPVVPIRHGQQPGVEALLRWTRTGGEIVAPDELIPIAETSGQMQRLGSWVIDRAFRDAASWSQMEVSINLSPTQFRDGGLVRYLEGKARTCGVDPARIILEVTENVVIETGWNADRAFDDLRAAGFRIALDDFGVGYSSLSYLRRFPFDRLKLDRSLSHGVAGDTTAMAIVETAAALGRRLGLDVVAEGIETQAEADLMQVAGCSHLQGYLISRPIEAADMLRYVALAQAEPRQASVG